MRTHFKQRQRSLGKQHSFHKKSFVHNAPHQIDINFISLMLKHSCSSKKNHTYQRVIYNTFKTRFWHSFCDVIERRYICEGIGRLI